MKHLNRLLPILLTLVLVLALCSPAALAADGETAQAAEAAETYVTATKAIASSNMART